MKSALHRLTPYLFLAPALSIIAVAFVYPVIKAGQLAFYRWSLGTPWASAQFIGTDNFAKMLSDEVALSSLGVTVAFALLVVLAEMVLGIAGALLLEGRIPFISVFRTVFILPIMLAPIVVGLVWRYLFDANFGLVNNLLAVFGVGKLPWLAESGLAFATIVVSDIWQWTPFVFIMILAGLQNLDRSALEAAAMDGASPWQAIWRVKLPMLLPIIVVTLMMRLIDAFRVLEVIYILTFGGPGRSTEVLSLYLYKTAFVGQDLGYASTLSVLLLLIVLLLSQAVLWINNPLRQGQNP